MPDVIPFTASVSRQPRALVTLNGTVVDGLLDCEVDNNNFYAADTFRLSFALQALEACFSMTALVEAKQVMVEVFMGVPLDPLNYAPADLTRFLKGRVDDLHFDPVSNTVELSGRDLTALFIDEKSTKKWNNQTASQIATALAVARGLTPVVTETTIPIGDYLQQDRARVGESRTEWDLLTWLAEETLDKSNNSFVVYVSGDELHFEPRASGNGQYVLQWTPPEATRGAAVFNGMSMAFSRNLTVLRDAEVVVSSIPMKSGKKAIVARYPSSKGGRGVQPGASAPKRQVYQYSFPNLTQDVANAKARSLHASITQHEVKLQARLPGDEVLLPSMQVLVKGTGTVFDQVYFLDSVRRRFSLQEGFVMDVSAKNHATESQVAS